MFKHSVVGARAVELIIERGPDEFCAHQPDSFTLPAAEGGAAPALMCCLYNSQRYKSAETCV